jgi:hypothetical protein
MPPAGPERFRAAAIPAIGSFAKRGDLLHQRRVEMPADQPPLERSNCPVACAP